jgi:hypothetical protein
MAPRFSSLPSRHHSLKVAGSGDLLRKLEDGEIDVAFCFDRDGFEKGALDERFAKRVISVEPLILVVPPGEVAMRGDLAALGNMRFVITETGCVYRHLFDKAFAEAGLASPKIAAEVGSIDTIARLVAAGAGLGLVPRLAVVDALDRGEIIEMPWPGAVRTACLVMIWRRRRVQPPALKLLLAAAGRRSDHRCPPSTCSVVPVVKALPTKKPIASAISPGCPTRPTGSRSAIALSVSSFWSPATKLQIGVSTQPGETTLTRIGASSMASARTSPSSAALTARRRSIGCDAGCEGDGARG